MIKVRHVDAEAEAEERQPLNAMVAENLKKAIIRKIYRDVDKKVAAKDEAISPIFRQYLLATGPSLAALSAGMTAGFSAVLLPQLQSGNDALTITTEEGSWIASMAALPMMLGCLCAGYPMDQFGRRKALIVSSALFTAGWAVLALAGDITSLYVGRFLTGFSVGLMSPMSQVYIAETSEPQHRGILLSGSPLAVAVGILISHALGTFLHWTTTAAICGTPPILCIIILLMVPESPIWLLGRGMSEKADDAFRWFHGTSEKSLAEWSTIVSKAQEAASQSSKATLKFRLMLKASFFKPFFVLNAFFFVQQFSGVNAVAFYSVTILKEVIPKINEYLATIIIDIVRFVISVGGVLLLRKFGRKVLSIASALGSAVSLLSLATYLAVTTDDSMILTSHNSTNLKQLNTTDNVVVDLNEGFTIIHCIPLLCLVFYISFVSIGLVPIPWVLTGELFSKELRGIGSGVTSSFGFICYFTVVKASPDMFEVLGKAGTFGLFSGVCVAGSIMLMLCLPETKDKTLMEIEAFYDNKEKNNDPETCNGPVFRQFCFK